MVEGSQLEIMLAELESHQLQVVLAPSKRSDRRDWDMIRVCLDKNPRWYSQLCSRHASSRGVRHGGFDTRIRRANVLRLLGRMIAGVRVNSKYEDEIRGVARRMGKGAA